MTQTIKVGEPTKTCPQCGKQVLEYRAVCNNNIGTKKHKLRCGFSFPMSCEGCGRETIGRVFCRECSVPGKYHWDRPPTKRIKFTEAQNIYLNELERTQEQEID